MVRLRKEIYWYKIGLESKLEIVCCIVIIAHPSVFYKIAWCWPDLSLSLSVPCLPLSGLVCPPEPSGERRPGAGRVIYREHGYYYPGSEAHQIFRLATHNVARIRRYWSITPTQDTWVSREYWMCFVSVNATQDTPWFQDLSAVISPLHLTLVNSH